MLRTIGHMRGHVYPRSHIFDRRNSGRLHGSGIVMGMLVVMLAMLAAAYAITLISTAF
ncbi:hypothetical protein ACFFP0_15380 [Rhizobium puerariae]|uniref:Uncharacterized protein n=1 Tax=Rhizobium puerariae TaxID=1585791 RepID=A0ABV6AI03_9HYPH